MFRQNLSIKQTFESTSIFGVEIHRDFIYVKFVGRQGHFPGSERQSSRLVSAQAAFTSSTPAYPAVAVHAHICCN